MENKKLQGSDGFYVFFQRQNRMKKTFSIGMSLMCERFFLISLLLTSAASDYVRFNKVFLAMNAMKIQEM